MAFNIVSGGLRTTGTTSTDFIVVQGSAVQNSTIEALAGADTILIEDGAPSATAVLINAAGDADILTFSGGTYTETTIFGGAGADFLTVASGASFTNTTIDGGLGNDNVSLTGNNLIFASSRLTLGGGVDALTIENSGSLANSFIGAGAGADQITISASGMNLAEILGGGGSDTITVVGVVEGIGMEINGDSSANGGGADKITFLDILSGSTVRGKGGIDTITVGGLAATGAEVLGNAGADVITVSGFVSGSTNLIGGGAGDDLITFTGGGISDGNSIMGGGGSDTIVIIDQGPGDGVDHIISGVVYAGAGADSINILSGSFAGADGFIGFSSLTDSTLEKMDTVTYGSGTTPLASGGLVFSVSAVTKTLTTGFAGGVGFSGQLTNGIIDSGAFTDQGTTAAGVTARATLLDGESNGFKLGTTFIFEDGSGVDFLFIQGGSQGVADDLVVKLDGNETLTGGGPAITFASGKITFS
jgi:hypothetical protein